MWRNVQRMRRLHGKAFDIAPTTYIMPEDYKRWNIDREVSNFKNILKLVFVTLRDMKLFFLGILCVHAILAEISGENPIMLLNFV